MKQFRSFRLDTANQCLWDRDSRVELAPKAFDVLRYLVEHAGRLVTQDELLQALWPDTYVNPEVIRRYILDIRRALADSADDPAYIRTLPKRGYQFVAPVSDGRLALPDSAPQEARGLVGRGPALDELDGCLSKMLAGQRQIIFVTGEAGIGKTTLVDAFHHRAARETELGIIRGQCVEGFGGKEPYYPMLEALGQLVRGSSGASAVNILARHAPTWLIQLPSLVKDEQKEALHQETLGTTRERMLREICEALVAITAERPLVVIFEDLHWVDHSTLDLISAVARRRAPARLLLLGTYRPVDVILSQSPLKALKQDLVVHHLCNEIALERLGAQDIAEYLAAKFGTQNLPAGLTDLIHTHSGGNALFMAALVGEMVKRGLIELEPQGCKLTKALAEIDLGVPETLQRMIELQMEQLSPVEQRVLKCASVAGDRFSVWAITGMLDLDHSEVEDLCERLAERQQFLLPAGIQDQADGSGSALYQFAHTLYREAFYRGLSAQRRMRLHRIIGERLETAWKYRLAEIASELAFHFQECRDFARAVRYWRVVAERCAARHALRETMIALTTARDLTANLPAAEQPAAELELAEQVGLAYRLMGDLDSSATEFERMFDVARHADNIEGQIRAQLSLASVASFMDRNRCLKAAEMAVSLCSAPEAGELRTSVFGQVAYWNLLFRGWNKKDARASLAALESVRTGGDRARLALHASRHSFFQSLSGNYREACRAAEEGIRAATEIQSLFDSSIAQYFLAWALLHVGEWGKMRTLLRSAAARADRNGHQVWVLLFGLLDSMLEIQAFSFNDARAACRTHLARAHELGHPLSLQMGHILLGLAELEAGDLASAKRSFNEIRELQNHRRILMDWIWKLPLQLGLAGLHLAAGDIQSARSESESFLSLAHETAECTWIGLAHHTRAQVALAEHDTATSDIEIQRGLSAIEGHEAPLAAWRLHALAAATGRDVGNHIHAQAVIRKLADSLSDSDPLKTSFFSAPQVIAVMSDYAAGRMHATHPSTS